MTFHAGWLRTFRRLLLWSLAAFRLLSGNLIDALLRRNTLDRRAIRLRKVLEGMGATFIKVGQQLSVRADILPYRYCQELAKMLDAVPPFPVEIAIARIERAAGKPIEQVFQTFDPVPIGSASIGCVYQAILPNGEKVAVKVRRPDIGPMFAADVRALGWLLDLGELLTFVRPGSTRDIRDELQNMLFEELNYPLEARYTDLFRRRAKKKKQTYISAPKVVFELCSDDVLVTEFISGVYLWEILAAIDSRDEAALASLRSQGFDPMVISQRMMRAFFWEALENLFFHADPHPANIVVRPDNSLVFIDFGSCGRFSSKAKRAYHAFNQYMIAKDVRGMTDTSLSLVEPLPPLDFEKVRREVEAFFWDWLVATESKHAEWWERCSGQMWMKFLSIARRFSIPINLAILRLFRATFLYDSIAMRLHKDLDVIAEFKRYAEDRGVRARKVVRRALRRRIDDGPTRRDYLAIENLGRLSRQVMHQLQRFLDKPSHRFLAMLGKAAFGVTLALRMIVIGAGLHLAALGALAGVRWLHHQSVSPVELVGTLFSSPAYQAAVVLFILIALRKTLVRLDDLDV